MTKGGVSVLIVTRQRPRQLRACLQAIAGQRSAVPFDVCVVVDGGPAQTQLALEFPTLRLQVAHLDQHPGQVAARNAALALATRDYIAWCDDDDRWLPGHLTALAAAADADTLAYCDAEIVFLQWHARTETPTVVRRRPLAFADGRAMLTQCNPIVPSSILYPRRLHERLGVFDDKIPHYWDWDWLLRAKDTTRFRRVGACLTLYAVDSGGSGQSADVARMEPALASLCAKHHLGKLATSNFALMSEDSSLRGKLAATAIAWDGDAAIW